MSLGEIASVALLVAVGALALWQSWGKWLHPLIDAGRDLYVPEQILSGRKLYRDVLYFYPPLAPYLLAAITRLAGSSLAVYAAIGIAVSTIACGSLYFVARACSGRVAAFAVSLLFVSVSLTGATTYGSNFIFPYAHAAVFAMTFFLIFEASIIRIFTAGATRAAVGSAIGAGLLAAWCKIEFAAFVLATFVMVCALALAARRATPRKLLFTALVALTLAGTSLAVVWVYFADSGPGHHWLFDNALPSALISGEVARSFYAKVTGSDKWVSNLALSLAGLALTSLHLWLVRALDRRRVDERHAITTAFHLCLLAVVVLVLATDLFFRAWTLLQLALLPLAVRDVMRVARESGDSHRWQRLTFPLLLWFSLCGTSRIYLNLAPVWYGFFLILPVWLLIVHLLFRELPDRSVYSRRAALLWLPLLLVIGWRNLGEQRQAYALKRHAIETPRGTFYDAVEERSRVLSEFIAYAVDRRLSGMVIIPEGLALNYLTSIPNPMSWHTFTPAEIPNRNVERRAIAEFERARPQYVAVTTQEAAAFGFRGFGVDYGLEISEYLRQKYAFEKQWRSGSFAVVLLRRRGP
jgi:hypothetical protein